MKEKINILLNKLYLHKITLEESEELRRLLTEENTFTEEVFELYEQKWGEASDILDKETQDRMFKNICQQIEFPIQQPQIIQIKPVAWKKWLRIASIVFLPLITAAMTWLFMTARWDEKTEDFFVSVDSGQRAQVQLPDGSKVWLNSASTLSYQKQSKTRIAQLSGEAYFEVKRNEKSPFVVEVDELSVEVLGTSFNVKGYEDDNYIATTLIKGSVRVQVAGESKVIRPADRIIYSKENHTLTQTTVNTDYTVSWINNQLGFDQETLEEIARVLERRFNVNIQFETDSLKKIRFTGNLKEANLENILQYIAFSAPIHYSMEDTVITIKANTP